MWLSLIDWNTFSSVNISRSQNSKRNLMQYYASLFSVSIGLFTGTIFCKFNNLILLQIVDVEPGKLVEFLAGLTVSKGFCLKYSVTQLRLHHC